MTTVRYLTPEQVAAKKLREKADAERAVLDDDPAYYIARHTLPRTGHGTESHVDASDETILDNVLCRDKRTDSRFLSAEIQTRAVSLALWSYMRDIYDYVADNTATGALALTVPMLDDDDEPEFVGYGFVKDAPSKNVDGPVRMVRTNAATTVVRKNPDAPDGWEILTSYPVSRKSEIPEKERGDAVFETVRSDFSRTLHGTRAYRSAGPLYRTYLDYACSGRRMDRDTDVRFTDGAIRILPHGTDPDAPQAPAICIKDDPPQGNRITFTVGHAATDVRSERHLLLVAKACPELVRTARRLMDAYDALHRNGADDLDRQKSRVAAAATWTVSSEKAVSGMSFAE